MGKSSFGGDYNNPLAEQTQPGASGLMGAQAVLKKRITAGGRQLSRGNLKFVFLSESGRGHSVFLCGHDNPGRLKIKILARSGEAEQTHWGGGDTKPDSQG